MNTGNDGNNAVYREHLVNAYLSRAGSFRKLLVTLLGFTAAFGFFIVWPYLSAVQQESQLTNDIVRLDAELSTITSQQERYKVPRERVQELRRMIMSGPPMLRDYIMSINSNPPSPFFYPDASLECRSLMDPATAQISQNVLQQLPNEIGPLPSGQLPEEDVCADSQGKQRLICRIDRFVKYQLCEYEQLFANEVLPALAGLEAGNTPLFDKAELEQQFTTVREALHQHIVDNPTFWHTFRGKSGMAVKLKSEIETLWKALSTRMAPVIEGLDERISMAKKQRSKLKLENAALVEQRKELNKRLKRIQSPIGNLPIGLTESVLLFPIVLVIGFAMATASLLEQLRLRRALSEAEKSRGDKILTSEELAQVAPLWIEPNNPVLQRLAR